MYQFYLLDDSWCQKYDIITVAPVFLNLKSICFDTVLRITTVPSFK